VKPDFKPLHKDDDKLVIQVSARQEDEFLWLRVVPADSTDGEPYGSLMLPGEQLVLVTCSEDGGSRTGRVVGPTPNYEQMKWWLHLCDTHPLHRGVCTCPRIIRSEGSETLHSLRVVDVIDMRLVDIGWQEKYVALSYVWGGAKPPKLRKSQIPVYTEKGSLGILLPTMPNTIQDLFTLTRKLGLRYLWFDSLCLVQDDPEDLRRGIMNMELVYESSYVTIITADTESADSGIPGVGSLYRTVEQERQVLKPGLEIMRVHSVDKHLQHSVWATRGWT
jgi:Heterokaryon incompatibility protein (HET)